MEKALKHPPVWPFPTYKGQPYTPPKPQRRKRQPPPIATWPEAPF